MRKAIALIFQLVSLKLLEMSGKYCYVVRRIPENLTIKVNYICNKAAS